MIRFFLPMLGFVVILPNLAFAQERCTVGALQGSYVFTGRGFIEPGEPGIQRVHYGIFVFDGTGKFSGKQSSSRGGKIGREKLQGAYTLEADCTGTMTFESVVNRLWKLCKAGSESEMRLGYTAATEEFGTDF